MKTLRIVNLAVLLLGLVSVASPAVAQDRSSLVLPSVMFVGAQALDLHSTHLALSRGHVEANPLMQHGAARVGVKLAITAGTIYAAHRINRRHPKVAKTLLFVASAVTFAVAVNNYTVARR